MLIIAELVLLAALSMLGTPEGQAGYEGTPGNQGEETSSFNTGYEGQPGNQSNGNGSNGNGGYEGHPGNQSNGGR